MGNPNKKSSTTSSSFTGVSFKDLAPGDVTNDSFPDDGLLNYQISKRHRSMHEEVGLPYRRSNPRRLIERAERRRSKPYLDL